MWPLEVIHHLPCTLSRSFSPESGGHWPRFVQQHHQNSREEEGLHRLSGTESGGTFPTTVTSPPVMDCMFVSPPRSYVETLTPKGMVSGVGAFGR